MDTLTQGTELQKQGKQEEALPFLNQVVQEQPNSYLAWTRLGEAQIETDRFAEALQSAERALALNLQYAPSWVVKARALNNLKRPEEALVSCNQAITYDPRLAFAHTYKGRIFTSQERD